MSDVPRGPRLGIRWSEHEAHKPYARPFGVSFSDEAGTGFGAIAVSGPDLLYHRQFQAAVLALAGELYRDPRVEGAEDPQRVWLDLLGELLPPADGIILDPHSDFDHTAGRVFRFRLRRDDAEVATLDAGLLLGYQDFQAAVAHQTGRLYRNLEVESVADPSRRQTAWTAALGRLLSRPAEAEAMSAAWPWR